MNLIDVLKTLSPKAVTNDNSASYILFSDIVISCRNFGYDNPPYIEFLLTQLANDNLLEIFYQDCSNDLILGARLK